MRIAYPLTAFLAVASTISIPGSELDGTLVVRGPTATDARPPGSRHGELRGRVEQLIKRFMQRPSQLTDKPEYGPPPKDDRPESAERPGRGFDKLDKDHQKYVEDYLDKEPKAPQVKMDMKWLKNDEEAAEGQTAMSQDKNGHFHLWYGSNDDDGRMKFHGMSKAYSMAANGIKDGKTGITLHYDPNSSPSRADVMDQAPHPAREDQTAPVLEEAPMNMLQREGFHVTLVLVPDGESRQEGRMTSSLSARVKDQQDKFDKEFDDAVKKAKNEKKDPPAESERKRVQVTYYDNRSKEVKDEMDKMLREGKFKLYRGPVVKDWPSQGDEIIPMLPYHTRGISDDKYFKNDDGTWKDEVRIGLTRPAPSRGPSEGQPDTKKTKGRLVDVSGKKDRKRSVHYSRAAPPRFYTRNIIDDIKTDTDNENDPTELAKIEFDDLLLGYTATRNNVSTLIWPVIQELMDSSDSIMIQDMALSIWAQLTNAPISVTGLYNHGLTRFTSLEQQVAEDEALSEADRQETAYVISTLRETYQQAWNAASQKANEFEGLDLLNRIAERLEPVDTSIVPPEDSELDLTAENIFSAFKASDDRFVTPEEYEMMWANAGDRNGTMAGNATVPVGNGTNSTNTTFARTIRRAVTLPTFE